MELYRDKKKKEGEKEGRKKRWKRGKQSFY